MIQLRNNYDKLVFNGAIGRVVAIDTERGQASASSSRTLTRSTICRDLDELGLAYAISMHKSQGSQYPAVVDPGSSERTT